LAPTSVPTIAPTAAPTTQPSRTPTSAPTWTPTSIPSPTSGGDSGNDKIEICHIPPGNPGNAHTITVSMSAWAAHEAHGDYQGACRVTTPAPTATPSGTPTPLGQGITLTSMCSEVPSQSLAWRVTNAGAVPQNLTWDVYGTAQRGSVTVAATTDAFFVTTTVANSPNTVRLFASDGRQIAAKAAGFAQCQTPITPTPTSAPTQAPEQPTVAPTSPPSSSPTSAPISPTAVPPQDPTPVPTLNPTAPPDAEPTEAPAPEPTEAPPAEPTSPPAPPEETIAPPPPVNTPRPIETMPPEPTAAPTIAPTTPPRFIITGGIKDSLNGRPLSLSLMRKLQRLKAGSITVVARTRTGEVYRAPLSSPFEYALDVPPGRYSVRLETSVASVRVASRPNRYELSVNGDREGIHFTVRLTDTKLSSQGTGR
jgi:hypothetical protein